LCDCLRITRLCLGCFQAGQRSVTRGSDGFKRVAFVGKIAFGSRHQIGDEVIATLELDFNLRKRIHAEYRICARRRSMWACPQWRSHSARRLIVERLKQMATMV